MSATKNPDLLISAAQMSLFAQMLATGTYYTAGETPRAPGAPCLAMNFPRKNGICFGHRLLVKLVVEGFCLFLIFSPW